MSHYDLGARLRDLEGKAVEANVHKDVILAELVAIRHSIEKSFGQVQESIKDLDDRVRHTERASDELGSVAVTARDLALRIDDLAVSTNARLIQVETDLSNRMARDALTSKGVSWASAILAALIISAITGTAGVVLSRMF